MIRSIDIPSEEKVLQSFSMQEKVVNYTQLVDRLKTLYDRYYHVMDIQRTATSSDDGLYDRAESIRGRVLEEINLLTPKKAAYSLELFL